MRPLPQHDNTVAVVSGGMDSVTMLYLMVFNYGYNPHVVSFDYGQKHVKELECAAYHANLLSLKHTVVPMKHLGDFLNSALTNGAQEVPEGHYAAENMKATVVPNRNMIMMSIAAGIAVSDKAVALGVGMHAGDHAVYPDCRPEFVVHMETTLRVANEGFMRPEFQIYSPFINTTKDEIVRIGTHQIPTFLNYGKTWSCYKGGEKHCGKCGTCVERIEAFQLAGVEDPTEYAAEVN